MPGHGADKWAHPAVILVATDLSDLDRLMPFAIQQASGTYARLILLHVLPCGMAPVPHTMERPHYDPSGARASAVRAMLPWCNLARAQQIACSIIVREGDPALQISAAARQFQADRVLLGTRTRGRVTKTLLGSVAEQVLRLVHSPVITVGPEACLPVVRSGGEKVVLHATTIGETSRPGAALACQIAAAQNARLVLLHVLPDVYERPGRGVRVEPDDPVLLQLQHLAAEVSGAVADGEVTVEPYVTRGNPSIEILAISAELRASMIVLSTSHRSFLRSLTGDGAIYHVLAHAPCPVLTLRVPAEVEAVGEAAGMASSLAV